MPRIAILSCVLLLSACATTPPEDPGAAPGVIRTGERVHVVRAGETFPEIARRYGVAERALRDLNRGLAEPLAAGLEIRIPPGKPEVRRIEPATAPR